MPLSAQGAQKIKTVLDAATKEGPTGMNGLTFVAVDKEGKSLIEHASGMRSINSQEPMDMETSFFLQLVEQGSIPLDDAEFIKKLAPEIGAKKVYADGVNGVDQQGSVTMRMLLNHTAGFAYAFFDPRVSMRGRPIGIGEFNGDEEDIINSPMVNQPADLRNLKPGSMWEYGINIDWAGIVLERHTGQKLNDYMQEHIFKALGISDVTMFPTENMKSNLAYMHQRDPTTGALSERDHLYHRAFWQNTKEQQQKFFHSGGGGLFAKPKEYLKVLTALLNDGVSPTTGNRILKKETVDLMWENQIPNQPNFARGGPPAADPLLSNSVPEMYPQTGNPPQGWGLSMFLTIAPGDTGRGANTGWWCGLANLFWWVDREKGIAGMLSGQVLPFGDPKVIQAWFAVEKTLYDNLE
ncbi:GPI transamidase component [Didymosphaeria variabile]|uniref:GPI transamidase component n=1 Tax=Didymosphaeria variabile TaxID=1932322 RepID=A0A9W8XTQ0_9PLEO|nr:GPI transamidase component [Didymosphaeria variabile]KAJ4358496.1 GPI transamidase component [Didymosphaeria variabile]